MRLDNAYKQIYIEISLLLLINEQNPSIFFRNSNTVDTIQIALKLKLSPMASTQ